MRDVVLHEAHIETGFTEDRLIVRLHVEAALVGEGMALDLHDLGHGQPGEGEVTGPGRHELSVSPNGLSSKFPRQNIVRICTNASRSCSSRLVCDFSDA